MRNRPTRARAALLSFLGAAVALQLGTGAYLTWGRPNLSDYDYHLKITRLIRREKEYAPGDVRVVMLGSSRTLNGFRAGELEEQLRRETGRNVRPFNFGIPGSGTFTNLLYLRRLLADGHRPDLVLLEVLPGELNGEVGTMHPTWERRLRRDELSLALRYHARPGFVGKWVAAHLSPFSEQRLLLLTHLVPQLLSYRDRADQLGGTDPFGWMALPFRGDAARRARALKLAHDEWAPGLARLKVGETHLRALRETLAECRANDIAVVMVLMPEGPVFRSWYSPGTRIAIDAALGDLSSETGVPVVDARDWVDDEGLFMDSHHLLPEGATRFTRRLADEVVLPALCRIPQSRRGGGS
jgi:hypothetical protein